MRREVPRDCQAENTSVRNDVGADRTSILRWYETIANKAIDHGFAFTVWDDGGMFGVYDRSARTWDTELIDRILPAGEDN